MHMFLDSLNDILRTDRTLLSGFVYKPKFQIAPSRIDASRLKGLYYERKDNYPTLLIDTGRGVPSSKNPIDYYILSTPKSLEPVWDALWGKYKSTIFNDDVALEAFFALVIFWQTNMEATQQAAGFYCNLCNSPNEVWKIDNASEYQIDINHPFRAFFVDTCRITRSKIVKSLKYLYDKLR